MSDNIARILALAAIGAEGGGGGGGALTPIVVYELPDVGEEGTLYLVPRQVTETKNVFDEYIYVNGGWEKIGSTDIDFSDYYTKQEVDAIAATLNSSIGERYLKPSGGIPNTDLSSGVQADLNKAKTALQTENDPVFGASAAAGITSSDITNWNNKLSSETDPVYSASPAAGITSANITSWSGKQDALVSGTNIKTINNTSILGSGNLSTKKQSLIVDVTRDGWDYVVDAEDVDIILGKVENQEDFDLFIRVQGSDGDTYTTPAHVDVYATSGNDYVQMVCDTIDTAWTRWSTFYGELVEGRNCTLVEHIIESTSNKVSRITGSESSETYPTTAAVTSFVNSNFLSKTNTNFYTPSADYHPATKKYVDDKANNYLAKNNTTAFTPTGDYQPATKKYVDDNAGGGSTTPTIIDASSVYNITNLPTVTQRELTITDSGLINQLESLEDDILDREKGGANLLFKIGGVETGTYIHLPMHLMRMNESSDMISFIMGDPLLSRYYTLYGVDTSGHKIWQLSWGADGLESVNNKVLTITNNILQSGFYYPSVNAMTRYVDSKVARYASMPNVSSMNVGDIVQYVGATTQNYTHGYFYECVLISETKTWQRLDVQPSSSYEFFDGSQSEWDALTQEQQKNILFAAVNEFELTPEEEAILLGVLGDKTGIDTDTDLEETLNAFLNIAGENE